MKGFRIPPQPSKKAAQQKTQTELANLQMAGRISQMMTQQLMQNVKSMSEDLNTALNQLMDVQYKLSAVIKAANIDTVQLESIANQQRLLDFNAAAANSNIKENLVEADKIGEDSTVTITSVAQDEKGVDSGIFRSRIKLSESGVPDLIASLQGKVVGDRVSTKLNGLEHLVEVLSIYNPNLVPVAAPEAPVVQPSENV